MSQSIFSARFTGPAFFPFVVATVLAACSEQPRTFESPRDVTLAGADLKLGAKTDERLGVRMPGSTGPGSTRMGTPNALDKVSASALQSDLTWTTPPGWTELPPRTMRAANFRVAGDERAECYLTLLNGDAGGLAANINRWRTQMSQPALSMDEISQLTKGEMLGRTATFLDIAGTWTGMSNSARQEKYRLIGMLLVEPEGSAFLKMVGPDSVIDPQIDAFRALAKSFRERGSEMPSNAVDTMSVASDGNVPVQQESHGSAAGLQWQVPAGWQRAPERATRIASYTVDAERQTECYITVLGGDAGGLLANVNRWRKQIGLGDQSPEDVAHFDKLPMLGGEASLVEFNGADGHTLLLGALYFAPERSVFVKLSGPADRVGPQRDSFRAFCRSIAMGEVDTAGESSH